MTNLPPSDSQDLSWLELPAITPEPAVHEIFERTKERFGHVRNTQRIVAHRPALALAQDGLSRAVQYAPDSGITPFERELMALVVSVENRCEPCVFAHAAILREVTRDPVAVGKIEVNYRHVDLTDRQRALADYAAKVTLSPSQVEKADIEKLKSAGLSEHEIIDAAAIIAYFNFSNRLNSSLGIKPNDEAYEANRTFVRD